MARWRAGRVRLAVWLTTLVAVLSFTTGVINIGATTVSGPIAPYIPPDVARAAGFTGALTGFLMLASVLGLRRRLRAAWYSTMVLLPVTALQGLAQSDVVSFPLVALSSLALPVVLVNYRRFDRTVEFSTSQLAALAALSGTLVYGTAGSYTLREEFANLSTLTDGFYYTITTASTVGYGDIVPLTQQARLFGMSVIVLGTASFALALGSLLGPAIEARLAEALGNMTDKQLELMENHVVVLGYGELTEPLLEELAGVADCVVVTPDQTVASTLRTRDIPVLTADPSDEEPLHQARIGDARAAIAATENDANDALAVLTVRSLNPGLRIVAAATDRENVDKLKRAGADAVISPSVIGGHLLVESALGDDGVESLADRLLGEEPTTDD